MNLFGTDIAGIIAQATAGQLKPATLTRTAELDGAYDPVEQKAHPAAAQETFTTEGIISAYSDRAKEAGLATEKHRKVLLIAQPLGTEPRPGDKITIEGETVTVVGIPERDPAGATWTIKGER